MLSTNVMNDYFLNFKSKQIKLLNFLFRHWWEFYIAKKMETIPLILREPNEQSIHISSENLQFNLSGRRTGAKNRRSNTDLIQSFTPNLIHSNQPEAPKNPNSEFNPSNEYSKNALNSEHTQEEAKKSLKISRGIRRVDTIYRFSSFFGEDPEEEHWIPKQHEAFNEIHEIKKLTFLDEELKKDINKYHTLTINTDSKHKHSSTGRDTLPGTGNSGTQYNPHHHDSYQANTPKNSNAGNASVNPIGGRARAMAFASSHFDAYERGRFGDAADVWGEKGFVDEDEQNLYTRLLSLAKGFDKVMLAPILQKEKGLPVKFDFLDVDGQFVNNHENENLPMIDKVSFLKFEAHIFRI